MTEKYAVIYNSDIENAKELAISISKRFENSFVTSISDMPENADFIIVVGGDGTLLKCARYYCNYQTPIFGFNMGRLGYLAQAKPDEVDFVADKIKNKEYTIQERIMLYSKDTNSVALNDMVIKGATFSRTSTLHLYINDVKLCSYLADGLIISTPTGSTAYALSAGGPVISPDIDCFTIVPICPHTLNARPIVIPSFEKIKVKTSDEPKDFQLTSDGQDVFTINKTDKEVNIEKYSKCAKLVILNDQKRGFYNILTEKLHWGTPPVK